MQFLNEGLGVGVGVFVLFYQVVCWLLLFNCLYYVLKLVFCGLNMYIMWLLVLGVYIIILLFKCVFDVFLFLFQNWGWIYGFVFCGRFVIFGVSGLLLVSLCFQ